MNILSLASPLYRKLRAATPKTREHIDSFLNEVKTSGAIPLGARKTDGKDAYWWVVYDTPSSEAAKDAQWAHIWERTPPGHHIIILTL